MSRHRKRELIRLRLRQWISWVAAGPEAPGLARGGRRAWAMHEPRPVEPGTPRGSSRKVQSTSRRRVTWIASQEHLKWESLVAVADASCGPRVCDPFGLWAPHRAASLRLREEAEMQSPSPAEQSRASARVRACARARGQRRLLELKEHLAQAAAQVWALASPGQLLQQMHEKAWPEGAELLEAAAEPLDLQKLGEVLVALRVRIDRLVADWAEMQLALRDWRSEAERQARHLPINHGILLKQAQVLHQMLSLLPHFDQCLRNCIARVRRPADEYHSALLYLQGSPIAASQPLKRVFTGEPNLLSSEVEEAEVLALSERLSAAKNSVDSVDWCDGARELYAVQGADPCEALAGTAASVLAEVHGWQASRAFLARVRRFQFSTAPNISRLEALVGLLAKAGHCAVERTHDETTAPVNDSVAVSAASELLRALGEDDQRSLREERQLLTRGAAKSLEILSATRPFAGFRGFTGLLRRVLMVEFLCHMAFEEASTWAFRVRSRGNALQLRLSEASQALSSLHHALQDLPSYRLLAFQEIHATGHWGKTSSGAGSSAAATEPLTGRFLTFLSRLRTTGQHVRPAALLDIGCGWGEWLPTVLRAAMRTGWLQGKVWYQGLDIARRPIRHLQRDFQQENDFSGIRFRFAALDACADVLPSLSRPYSVVVVRHVFQHLSIKDALDLLMNLKRLKPPPRFLLLSSWRRKENRDLEAFGGPGAQSRSRSSAFSFVSPRASERFRGYDLRKAPFRLRPLAAWPEIDGEMLDVEAAAILEVHYRGEAGRAGYEATLNNSNDRLLQTFAKLNAAANKPDVGLAGTCAAGAPRAESPTAEAEMIASVTPQRGEEESQREATWARELLAPRWFRVIVQMLAGQGGLLLCMLPVLLSCGLTEARRVRAGRTERGILDEIQELLGTERSQVISSRAPFMEEVLRHSFEALPKSGRGRVGAAVANHALHRLFLQVHSWQMKDLQPVAGAWHEHSPTIALKRAPAKLHDAFDQKLQQHGLSLNELSVLAATIEQLVRDEADVLLNVSYQAAGFYTRQGLEASAAREVMEYYMSSYILGTESSALELTASDLQALHQNIGTRHMRRVPEPQLSEEATSFRSYPRWKEVQELLEEATAEVAGKGAELLHFQTMHLGLSADVKKKSCGNKFSGHKQLLDTSTDPVLSSLTRAQAPPRGQAQEKECQALKRQLVAMEERPGRVLLRDFYRPALDQGTLEFTESAEFLRQQGASPTALLNAAGAQRADKAHGAVQNLATGGETQGLSLEGELSERLWEVAAQHSGEVPLHGRLFAQWLHHAFPRDCPFPHVSGTVRQSLTQFQEERHERAAFAEYNEMQEIVNLPLDAKLPSPSSHWHNVIGSRNCNSWKSIHHRTSGMQFAKHCRKALWDALSALPFLPRQH
ncbi:unnamed protein product [Symbiodinium sp. CCMP2456]|nr:unnamed protein product [Symbiodinium sp. CCMP2456]